MRIIQPSYEIVNMISRADGIRLLQEIEHYGRISHRTEDRVTEDSWERFIQTWVVNHGDWSITEHHVVTVIATVSRGIFDEIARHRLGAYAPDCDVVDRGALTAESTRFVNLGKSQDMTFIIADHDDTDMRQIKHDCLNSIETAYRTLIALGANPEDARDILPLSIATKFAVTYNLRQWRTFFLMRTTREAHHLLRAVASGMLATFQQCIPLLYDDIAPGHSQKENLSKAR